MTGTNSSNDRLVLRQNVEKNSNEYFFMQRIFSGMKSSTAWLGNVIAQSPRNMFWVQSYFIDLLWFIEWLSVKIFIYSSFVTIDDVIFLFLKNFPS